MAHFYNQRAFVPPALFVDMHSGMVPPNNPVVGGADVNGEPIYCGRCAFAGDVIPGKVVSSHGCCYISYGGEEKAQRVYQVLTNPNHANLAWVSARNGNVPTGALVAGAQADGSKLYFGRTYHNGSLVVGKVHTNHGCLYFPFAGSEHSSKNYEVLVVKEVHTSGY